jgi:hypothetical protein
MFFSLLCVLLVPHLPFSFLFYMQQVLWVTCSFFLFVLWWSPLVCFWCYGVLGSHHCPFFAIIAPPLPSSPLLQASTIFYVSLISRHLYI